MLFCSHNLVTVAPLTQFSHCSSAHIILRYSRHHFRGNNVFPHILEAHSVVILKPTGWG